MKLLVAVFVFLTLYTILTLPAAQATQIRVIYGPFNLPTLTLKKLVKGMKVGQVSFQGNNVVFDLENATEEQLESVIVYKCKAMDPQTCSAQASYDTYAFTNSKLRLELDWTSLRDSNSYSRQTGNLLMLVKASNAAGDIRISFWHNIVKYPSGFTHSSPDISNINIYAPDPNAQNAIWRYVIDNGMVPSQATSVEFVGASSLYELSFSPPSLSTNVISGSKFSPPISSSFSFLLPKSGSTVMNGITLAESKSGLNCGNKIKDPGENQDNCCFDVPCSSGFYCDSSKSCQLESSIRIEIIPPKNTKIKGCKESHILPIFVSLKNPPSGHSITSQSYVLNGGSPTPVTCSPKGGNVFSCPVIVPPDPACDEGTFILKKNSISFNIVFQDGQNPSRELKLTAPFADITVGSWTCGNNICEKSLGETSSNCCYDCGCSSGYCDVEPNAQPSSGVCISKLSNSNLIVKNILPSSMTFYNPSNKVTFDYEISSPPKSISVGSESCSSDCLSDSGDCTASCQVSCSHPSSGNGKCSLTFTISNYVNTRGYSIKSRLSVPISYKNGPFMISETLTSSSPIAYSFGPRFCGDLICDSNEKQDCCYDCGCTNGYCNTFTVNKPTPDKDVCIAESMGIVIDSTTATTFVDQILNHELNFTAHIANLPPKGISLYQNAYSCLLENGIAGQCTMQCTTLQKTQPDKQPFSCIITLPFFYDPNSTQIKITRNSLNVTVSFNNGSRIETKDLTTSLPDLTIEQKYHCGMDGCETNLGENSANCCIDCPCSEDSSYGSGYICVPGGNYQKSACISNETITAVFESMTPDPIECTIKPPSFPGGGCLFSAPVQKFTFDVNNPPHLFSIIKSEKLVDGNTSGIRCSYDNGEKKINCTVTHDPIKETGSTGGAGFTTIQPGEEEKDITFLLEVAYKDNNMIVKQNMTVPTTYTLSKNYTEIESCEDQVAAHQAKISKYKKNRNILLGIILFLWSWVVVETVRCIISKIPPPKPVNAILIGIGIGPTACPAIWDHIVIASCGTSILLPIYSQIDTGLEQTRGEKDAICQAPDSDSLGDAVGKMGDGTFLVIQGVTTLVCLIGTMGGGGGEEGTSTAWEAGYVRAL